MKKKKKKKPLKTCEIECPLRDVVGFREAYPPIHSFNRVCTYVGRLPVNKVPNYSLPTYEVHVGSLNVCICLHVVIGRSFPVVS